MLQHINMHQFMFSNKHSKAIAVALKRIPPKPPKPPREDDFIERIGIFSSLVLDNSHSHIASFTFMSAYLLMMLRTNLSGSE